MLWMFCLLAMAELSGVVTDALTRQPISGVRLRWAEERNVTTDSQGVFRVALTDGRYSLVVTHSDYLAMSIDPVVMAGAPVRLDFAMTPLARLSGKLVDEDGEPLAGRLMRMIRIPWAGDHTAKTGADGRFTFSGLRPGSWLLVTESGPRVYYPSALMRADAERIPLRAGAAVDGYTVRVRSMVTRRLAGVVLDPDGRPAVRAEVKLIDFANSNRPDATTRTNERGAFEFKDVPEREWRVNAELARGTAKWRGYSLTPLQGRDVDDVVVRLSAPFALHGFVDRDEPRDREGNRKLTAIYLWSQDPASDRSDSTFHEQDGRFTIKDIYPGTYRVLPAGWVGDYYVSGAYYGNRDVTTEAFDIATGELPLRIVYKPDGGRIAGTVEKGSGAIVVLVPQDEALLSIQFIRSDKCDREGRFVVRSLRPGAYYAFAFDRIEAEMLEDVEFVRRLTARAKRVVARAGETGHVDLRAEIWPEY